jgi:alpha-tubulin suppressor-like RCC1 family protein
MRSRSPLGPGCLAGRLARQLAHVLLPALVLTTLGCGEDGASPVSPGSTTLPLDAAAAAALMLYQVSGGFEHTCGVTTDRRAYCWGKDYSGELGDGSAEWGLVRPKPVAVGGGLQFRQVSAGGEHTCGVTTDYRAYCWGGNAAGQLGDGTATDRLIPVPVAGGLRFRQVDAGLFAHTCGVTYPDGRAYCWGNNSSGQLGDGTTDQHLNPSPVASGRKFRQVSTGEDHTCGVTTDDQAFCWGSNDVGQIGDGSTARRRARPRLVAGGHAFRQLSAGSYYTCAVTTTRQALCWGYGGNGQIGDGRTYQRFTPRLVAGRLSFDRVGAGKAHTCGETTTNQAYCWGLNASGQLGDGTTARRLTPVRVLGGLSFSQVDPGAFHTCGVTSAAIANCWGANAHGEIGDGTTINRGAPVPVVGTM